MYLSHVCPYYICYDNERNTTIWKQTRKNFVRPIRMLRNLHRLRAICRAQSEAAAVINYQETKITQLANGLRVATEDMGLETNTVGLWIDCGTRYERLHEMGTAHFFEHLVFKVNLLFEVRTA